MKRLNNLYYKICKTSNIRFIYDGVISKNTKNRKKVLNFDNYYIQNIMYIRNKLVNKSYIPLEYNIFLIREPKVRIIMSQSLYDKIINHLVSYFILKPSIEPCLIDTNVATREEKGTDYAIKTFKKYMNIMNRKYDKFYILKFDISKYFYNIDHNILKELINKRIKDKDSIDIINKIIDSTDLNYVNNQTYSIGGDQYENSLGFSACSGPNNCGVNKFTRNTVTYKLRALTMQEAFAIGCTSTQTNVCPNWFRQQTDAVEDFWLMSANSANNTTAWYYNMGYGAGSLATATVTAQKGLRPVIEINK